MFYASAAATPRQYEDRNMSNQQEYHPGSTQRRLPPIHAVMDMQDFPCYTCGVKFERSEQRDYHQPRCDRAAPPTWQPRAISHHSEPSWNGSVTSYAPTYQLHGSPPQPVRSIEQQQQHHHHHHLHQQQSHHNLALPPQPDRRASSPIPSLHNISRRGSDSTDKGVDKREQKKNKEKQSRNQHAMVLHCFEDLLQNYINLECKNTQAMGNGNEAGLEIVKIDMYRNVLALLNHFVHRDHMRALQDGTLETWQQEMRQVVNSWHGSENLLYGTWLDESGGRHFEACEHLRGQKRCTRHNHPNWLECRKERHRKKYQQRAHAWRAEQTQQRL